MPRLHHWYQLKCIGVGNGFLRLSLHLLAIVLYLPASDDAIKCVSQCVCTRNCKFLRCWCPENRQQRKLAAAVMNNEYFANKVRNIRAQEDLRNLLHIYFFFFVLLVFGWWYHNHKRKHLADKYEKIKERDVLPRSWIIFRRSITSLMEFYGRQLKSKKKRTKSSGKFFLPKKFEIKFFFPLSSRFVRIRLLP